MAANGKRSKEGNVISSELKPQEVKARVERLSKQEDEQIELAERRMGRTPTDLLRWVVEFAQGDLDLLRPEERAAKGYDLRVLPDLVNPQVQRQPAKSWETRGGTYELGPMPEETLRRIHGELAAGLRKLFSGESWRMPKWDTWLYRSSPDRAARTRFGLMRQLDNEPETVLSAVLDLILEAGGKLRACPECWPGLRI